MISEVHIDYWWRDLGLWVWYATQTSGKWVACFKWAKTEETTSFSIKEKRWCSQLHRLQWCCASRIINRRPDCQWEILFGRYKMFTWSNTHERPGLFKNNSWILHHGNAPSHNKYLSTDTKFTCSGTYDIFCWTDSRNCFGKCVWKRRWDNEKIGERSEGRTEKRVP